MRKTNPPTALQQPGEISILCVEIQVFFFRRGDNLRAGFLQHQHLFALRVHRLALRGQAEICLRAGLLDALRNPADGLNVVRAARHRHPPEHVIAVSYTHLTLPTT